MKRRSIGFRLTVWYSCVLSLGLILFSVALRYSLAHQLRADLDVSLSDQLLGFERYLSMEDEDPGIRLIREIDEYSRSMPWDHLLAVYDASGSVVYANRDHLDSGVQPHYVTASRNLALREGTFRVYLGISTQPVEHVVERLTMLLIAIVPVFVLISAGVGRWLSRKALSPVQVMTARAQSIGVNNLSERLHEPQTGDEIQHLAETWNGMLERLEGAVEKIRQFTADASHELRTPTAIIRFSAESALRKPRTEVEYRTALNQIQAESERMTALIEDLLYLTRTGGNTEQKTVEEVDLGAVTSAACDDFALLAARSGIALRRECASGRPIVSGNEAALRRMLRALIDNAIKYTPTGGTVLVKLALTSAGAELNVSDTGIGIAPEARPHVFERFYRADASRSKESGGFGLGLSIAQAIARQHGTEIQLASVLGAGSTFSVVLRLAVAPQAVDTLVESL